MLSSKDVIILCGELKSVISKLRQEGFSFTQLEEGELHGIQTSWSLFCIKEPSVSMDILQLASSYELRKETQSLLRAAITIREKLWGAIKSVSSSPKNKELDFPLDALLNPLLDIIKSPAISASATAQALSMLHRMVAQLGTLNNSEKSKKHIPEIINAAINCVFRQTESGDDEIAIMWILELIQACCSYKDFIFSENHVNIERVIVVLYKNSIASANADMLRRLAVQKLTNLISNIYEERFLFDDNDDNYNPSVSKNTIIYKMFNFLCRRLDLNKTVAYSDMETCQVCLQLLLSVVITSTDTETGRIMLDKDPSIHELVSNNLFCALLEICQLAMKPRNPIVPDNYHTIGFVESNMIKVVSMSNINETMNDEINKTGTTTLNTAKDNISDNVSVKTIQSPSMSNSNKRSSSTIDRKPIAELFRNTPLTFDEFEKCFSNELSSNAALNVTKDDDSLSSSNDNKTLSDLNRNGSSGSLAQKDISPRINKSLAGTEFPAKVAYAGRISHGVLTTALRIVHLLIADMNSRRCLRSQIQAFFNAIFLGALKAVRTNKQSMHNNNPAICTESEARRMILETLIDLFADQTVVLDLYCNYDCSLDCTDVFENLFIHLSNHSFPKHMRKLALDHLQLLSLRCIHIGISTISHRCHRIDKSILNEKEIQSLNGACTPASLAKIKLAKRQLFRCAQEFNRKPKYGINALIEAGIVPEPPEPSQIASFLRNTQGLEKVMIGEFLGGNADLNIKVRYEFFDTFNFQNISLLSALRMVLEAFRLPGEAQMIDRIVETFASIAIQKCEDAKQFPTVDCIYLLCFSIILLNTDLHNPNIAPEKKMSLDKFIFQNKSYGPEVDKGKPMDINLLKEIYNDIKHRELNTMSDASVTAEITIDRWRDLIVNKTKMKLISENFGSGDIEEKDMQTLLCRYDKQMFSVIQNSAFTALSVVFSSGDPQKQPKAVEMALEGITNCAEVAAFFSMVKVLDRITVDVCKFTTLLLYAQSSNSNRSPNGAAVSSNNLLDQDDEDYDDDNLTEMEDEDENESDQGTLDSTSNNSSPPPILSLSLVSDESSSAKPLTSQKQISSKKSQGNSSNQSNTLSQANYFDPDLLGSEASILNTVAILSKNPKAQTASSSLFEIVHHHGTSIRQAWPHVIYCILRLFDLQLIPPKLLRESSNVFPGEPKFELFSNESRITYHKTVSKIWIENLESQLEEAVANAERSKGWISWMSGQSTKEAEEKIDSLEEKIEKNNRSLYFASQSLGLKPNIKIPPATEFEGLNMANLGSLVLDSKKFDNNTYIAFVRGIILASNADSEQHSTIVPLAEDVIKDLLNVNNEEEVSQQEDQDIRPDITISMLAPSSLASKLFGLHLFIEVVCANINRINCIWKMVRLFIVKYLRTAKYASSLVEKATVGLLRITMIYLKEEYVNNISDDIMYIIKLLWRYPKELAPGFKEFMQENMNNAIKHKIWTDSVNEQLSNVLNNTSNSSSLTPTSTPVSSPKRGEDASNTSVNADSKTDTKCEQVVHKHAENKADNVLHTMKEEDDDDISLITSDVADEDDLR